jgi:hypothetical protein
VIEGPSASSFKHQVLTKQNQILPMIMSESAGINASIDGSDESRFRQYRTLEIRFTDTGCGIAAEDLPRVFKQFTQFNANQLQGGGGTGLGLWISQKIIVEHGGDISIQSGGISHGATITLAFRSYIISTFSENEPKYQSNRFSPIRTSLQDFEPLGSPDIANLFVESVPVVNSPDSRDASTPYNPSFSPAIETSPLLSPERSELAKIQFDKSFEQELLPQNIPYVKRRTACLLSMKCSEYSAKTILPSTSFLWIISWTT